MKSDAPLVKITGLYENTSKTGTYFVGYLGSAKIVILKNRDAGREGEPGWALFIAQRPERNADQAAPRSEPRPAAPRQERPRVDPELNDALPSWTT